MSIKPDVGNEFSIFNKQKRLKTLSYHLCAKIGSAENNAFETYF